MADTPNRYEDLLARLASDPGFAAVAKPDAGLLVWAADATRILWASPSARNLQAALTSDSGYVNPPLRARDRLKALASGLAPREGVRLERLWLDPGRLGPPVTCACRLALLDQEVVLVTVIVGTVPKVAPRPRAASPQPEPEMVAAPQGVEPARPADRKPRGTVRFVWQMDAETRFI